MDVIKIQWEKACQSTAEVTMKLWPTTMLQTRFYWLLTDFWLPFLFLLYSNWKTYFSLYLNTYLKITWKVQNGLQNLRPKETEWDLKS